MDEERNLSEWMGRLPTRRDDEVAIQVLEGRALSRSETNLHLALPTGLVAVPLDSIVKVTSVAGTREIVRLVVRNPHRIEHLLRVAPRAATLQSGQAPANRGEKIGSGILGPGVSTCDYYDSTTVTGEPGDEGGARDASDDEEPVCQNDDVAQ